jgi:hypothetical protein
MAQPVIPGAGEPVVAGLQSELLELSLRRRVPLRQNQRPEVSGLWDQLVTESGLWESPLKQSGLAFRSTAFFFPYLAGTSK